MANTTPISKNELLIDFRKMGILDGANLMVHPSLKSIGRVIGGAQTVVEALIEAIGENGTLVMPTASPEQVIREFGRGMMFRKVGFQRSWKIR